MSTIEKGSRALTLSNVFTVEPEKTAEVDNAPDRSD
jgi:hypothetical protein